MPKRSVDKSVIDGDKVEVLPPEGKRDRSMELTSGRPGAVINTPGQIKSELRKVYTDLAAGRLEKGVAYTMNAILRNMLKAAEIEHAFNLANEDPDADTPVMSGLQILPPAVPLTRGRIVGGATPADNPKANGKANGKAGVNQKGKTNGKGNGKH